MVRKAVKFAPTMLKRVERSVGNRLIKPPVWFDAMRRVPPAPATGVSRKPPSVRHEREDRLLAKLFRRVPEARDEAVDLTLGSKSAVRRSSAWRFVYQWIVAMDDGGLSEEDAFNQVRAQHEAAHEKAKATAQQWLRGVGDVTQLSAQWQRATSAEIRKGLTAAAAVGDHLPANWDVPSASFKSPQEGAGVVLSVDDQPGTHSGEAAAGASLEKSSGDVASSAEDFPAPEPAQARYAAIAGNPRVRAAAASADDAVDKALQRARASLDALAMSLSSVPDEEHDADDVSSASPEGRQVLVQELPLQSPALDRLPVQVVDFVPSKGGGGD